MAHHVRIRGTVHPWNYPVWIASSVLAGMLAATCVRRPRGIAETTATDDRGDAPSRFGMAGGVLAWFAVGCPHGGAIEAVSAEGAGTTITIRLPLSTEPAQPRSVGGAHLVRDCKLKVVTVVTYPGWYPCWGLLRL